VPKISEAGHRFRLPGNICTMVVNYGTFSTQQNRNILYISLCKFYNQFTA